MARRTVVHASVLATALMLVIFSTLFAACASRLRADKNMALPSAQAPGFAGEMAPTGAQSGAGYDAQYSADAISDEGNGASVMKSAAAPLPPGEKPGVDPQYQPGAYAKDQF